MVFVVVVFVVVVFVVVVFVVVVVMVFMIMMAVHVVGFLLPMHVHGDPGAGDAAFFRAVGMDVDPGDAEAVHALHKGAGLRQQLQQSRGEHIPRRAHGTVKIQRFHRFASIWLIRPARKPAPKPLSILTTATPLAQELSIASNADRPPKLAP